MIFLSRVFLFCWFNGAPTKTLMSAFFFAAGVTRAQVRPSRSQYEASESYQTWDECVTGIVYSGDLAQAQKQFEGWCLFSPEGEKPVETVIKRLVGAQFIEPLLTESGSRALDWTEIAREVTEEVTATPVDDFEQGYWVDMNLALPPGKLSADLMALERDLPEDFRSGLNWSPDKQFLFLVTVLSPPLSPVYVDETIDGEKNDEDEIENDEADEATQGTPLEANIATLPEMRDKEAAAVVRARNSVAAAWLWRKFAADSPLAQNELQVLPVTIPMPVVMND